MVNKSHPPPLEEGDPDLVGPERPANPGWLSANKLSARQEDSSPAKASDRRHAVNRRDGIWRAFLYGNFHPRRRNSRRTIDKMDYWFDWHEPRILFLALGIFLLSCTDALFTLNLLNAGAGEANAVMASILDSGIDSFVSAKITLTGTCLLILVVAARRKFIGSFSVEHLLQSIFVGYVLLICYQVYMFWYVFELQITPGHLPLWPIHG